VRITDREYGFFLDEFPDFVNRRVGRSPSAFGDQAASDVVVNCSDCISERLCNISDFRRRRHA
jgi:hypothetical protein